MAGGGGRLFLLQRRGPSAPSLTQLPSGSPSPAVILCVWPRARRKHILTMNTGNSPFLVSLRSHILTMAPLTFPSDVRTLRIQQNRFQKLCSRHGLLTFFVFMQNIIISIFIYETL
ncbi:Metal tolerance protein C4 [Zea mays]|uniref:Metal tolerance protein C4 n=1 Tax=Zea mays TaxID=4577 RepID=A0A1D6EDE7_MAIZE|nr:Metal tolerance protein C4 [Zea mays]